MNLVVYSVTLKCVNHLNNETGQTYNYVQRTKKIDAAHGCVQSLVIAQTRSVMTLTPKII